jgi:hypothetical protein
MTPVTLAQARNAKSKLRKLLRNIPDVNGIGLTSSEYGYALKVNLRRALDADAIPDNVDGVPVIVDVVGNIRAT